MEKYEDNILYKIADLTIQVNHLKKQSKLFEKNHEYIKLKKELSDWILKLKIYREYK